MSVDTTRGIARWEPIVDGLIRQRMSDVRDALHFRRLARDQLLLCALYDEHNLFDEALGARRKMMTLLRTARSSWRRALGLAP